MLTNMQFQKYPGLKETFEYLNVFIKCVQHTEAFKVLDE